MFGEGMVSFGTWSPVVTPDRYSKASPKIVCPSPTRSWTLRAAVSKSRSPALLWKCTASFWSVGSTPSSW
jgi:hypothetical protein